MALGTNITIRSVNLRLTQEKLAAAAPRILENNRAMVTAMLDMIKPIVEENTPIGPGRFGFHLRDTFRVDVRSLGLKTTGVLKSASTGYWREYGTLGSFHKGNTIGAFMSALQGQSGEAAHMTAHHAASGIRRFLNFYYGGMVRWWATGPSPNP